MRLAGHHGAAVRPAGRALRGPLPRPCPAAPATSSLAASRRARAGPCVLRGPRGGGLRRRPALQPSALGNGAAQRAQARRDDSTPGPRPTRPRPFSGLPVAPPERKVGAGRRQGQSPRACPARAEQELRPASEIGRSSPARLPHYRPWVDT